MAAANNLLVHEETKPLIQDIGNENISIKQETDNNIVIEEHNVELQIKIGNEALQRGTDNPFKNIQLEVKQEIDPNIYKEHNQSNESQNDIDNNEDIKKTSQVDHSNVEFNSTVIKEELTDDDLVSYDYPEFDTGSADSREATALGNVETCLQEDGIKSETEDHIIETHEQKDYEDIDVKLEPDVAVTETHLISNKVINTTSTITNPQDGLIESQTTKTLVMEILPMTHTVNAALSRMGNPEEILPTSYDTYNVLDYKNTFQLNSITGNCLSLEQEAYGLLKTTRRPKKGEKRFLCPKCPKILTSKSGIKRHLEVHGSIERYQLGHMKRLKNMQSQREKKEKEIEEESKLSEKSKKKIKIKIQNCDVKDNKLKIKIDRKDVKTDIKKEGYECTCGKYFQRRTRMETCLRSHDLFADANLNYSCMTCTKQFKDKHDLKLHRKKAHSKKRFPCKFCPTDYSTRKELFRHLRIHQKVQLMEYKVISEVMKGKQKLRCFMCSRTCGELSELKSHVMYDHKEPYICPHCKKTFPKIIDFGNHTKTSHPEVEGQSVLNVLEAFSKLVRAWKCEECEVQFHEADKLAMHKIEKHSPDMKVKFQCTDCKRVFASQSGLRSHRRVHHSTESTEDAETVEKGIMCLECRKMCKDMTALTSHMRLHSPDRRYPCKFCDFRFATPEKRRTHAEIHTGDMRYVCFICEYQCSSENRLKHHKMSMKHLNMKEYLLTGKPLIEEQSTSQKTKNLKIKKQSSGKKRKKEESESESSSDSEAESVSTCDVCGDKFPDESKMLEHKQTHPFIEFPNDDKPTRIFFK